MSATKVTHYLGDPRELAGLTEGGMVLDQTAVSLRDQYIFFSPFAFVFNVFIVNWTHKKCFKSAVKMCGVPEIPFSTYIKEPVNFNRSYSTGEKVTLACKAGFEEKPEGGTPVRICISGGWTRFPFKCEGETIACCSFLSKITEFLWGRVRPW